MGQSQIPVNQFQMQVNQAPVGRVSMGQVPMGQVRIVNDPMGSQSSWNKVQTFSGSGSGFFPARAPSVEEQTLNESRESWTAQGPSQSKTSNKLRVVSKGVDETGNTLDKSQSKDLKIINEEEW